MKYSKFTYQKSGVNIQSADKFVEFLRKNTGQKKQILPEATRRPEN